MASLHTMSQIHRRFVAVVPRQYNHTDMPGAKEHPKTTLVSAFHGRHFLACCGKTVLGQFSQLSHSAPLSPAFVAKRCQGSFRPPYLGGHSMIPSLSWSTIEKGKSQLIFLPTTLLSSFLLLLVPFSLCVVHCSLGIKE